MGKVSAWLRMAPGGGLPDSEASYMANSACVDTVVPANGGLLTSDGGWYQDPAKMDTDFAKVLKQLAVEAGQVYTPAMGTPVASLRPVLDDENIQWLAASNLAALAYSRFDGPWDAVTLDVADVPPEYKPKFRSFVYRLAHNLWDVGLGLRLAYPAVKWDSPSHFDLVVAGRVADAYMPYAYAPGTNWTHSDTVMGIEYALSHVPRERVSLGLALYSSYYEGGSRHDITYAQAMEIVHSHNSFLQWIEYDEGKGKIARNEYADTRVGQLFVSDRDVIYSRLELVDEYGLDVMLFTPGLEDPRVWDVIADWRS